MMSLIVVFCKILSWLHSDALDWQDQRVTLLGDSSITSVQYLPRGGWLFIPDG